MSGHAARIFFNGDSGPDPLRSDYDWLEMYLDRRIEELKRYIAEYKTHPSMTGPDGEDYGVCRCDATGYGCLDIAADYEDALAEQISQKRFRIND